MAKRYDRAYFDRWYRDPGYRVGMRGDLERTVHLAVAVTEYVLGRRLRSVLDVGCGEGRWQPVLQRLRPGSRYAGVDPSPYVVRRFGRRRNIRQGSIDHLDGLGLDPTYDLVACCDVLHYLDRRSLERALPALATYVGGVAYLELYTSADELEGDLRGFYRRPPATYRSLLTASGLVACGLQCWVPRTRAGDRLGALAVATPRPHPA